MVLILSQFLNIKTMVLYSSGSINRESPVVSFYFESLVSLLQNDLQPDFLIKVLPQFPSGKFNCQDSLLGTNLLRVVDELDSDFVHNK